MSRKKGQVCLLSLIFYHPSKSFCIISSVLTHAIGLLSASLILTPCFNRWTVSICSLCQSFNSSHTHSSTDTHVFTFSCRCTEAWCDWLKILQPSLFFSVVTPVYWFWTHFLMLLHHSPSRPTSALAERAGPVHFIDSLLTARYTPLGS